VGAKTIPQDSFIRQLTDNLSPATNHLPTTSASPVSSPPPANPFAANMVANSSPSNPVVRLDLWFQGQPARFDRATLRFITEAVNNTLADLGYFFARVNVTVLPEPPRQTAILRVEILDEGSKAILDQIEIIGAEKNPREVILDFLGLKLGMAWNRDLLLERERLLWQSARFVSYKLSTLPPDSSGKQALRIELREMREAPPLSQALSRSEKTLLKFQDWMMSWPASQEDFVITLTQESPPGTNSRVLHAVLATNGMAMALSDIDPQAPQGIRLSYGLIASTNGDGLFALDQQRKLVSPPLNQNVIAFVNFLPNPDPTASNRFDLLMGGGREQHEPIVSNQIPARGRRVPQPGPSGTKRYHLRAGRHDHHA
jgi:hypothetical protein